MVSTAERPWVKSMTVRAVPGEGGGPGIVTQSQPPRRPSLRATAGRDQRVGGSGHEDRPAPRWPGPSILDSAQARPEVDEGAAEDAGEVGLAHADLGGDLGLGHVEVEAHADH